MTVRKGIGRAQSTILVLLALGSFLATYNLVSMVMRNKAEHSRIWEEDGLKSSDPVIKMPGKVMGSRKSRAKYHVALTATDAPYSQWQSRIMYYWYNKMKDSPGSDMGTFTRILHSGKPDKLMDEIPSFVVDPLPQGLDRVSNYAAY